MSGANKSFLEIGTCETCKHWWHNPNRVNDAICRELTGKKEDKIQGKLPISLITGKDFGCIHWGAKDEGTEDYCDRCGGMGSFPIRDDKNFTKCPVCKGTGVKV